MRELDRVACEEFGLPGVVLMENAGRELAAAVLESGSAGQRVLVLCGRGNNGGDGYVLARYLHDAGRCVTLLEAALPGELSPDAAVFRAVCVAMGVAHQHCESASSLREWLAALAPQELMVDALIGTGFHGTLREPEAALLGEVGLAVQSWDCDVVAVDCPSGLDVDGGTSDAAVLCAKRTLTLACSKPAFEVGGAHAVFGEVRVLSIGIPRAAYERIL